MRGPNHPLPRGFFFAVRYVRKRFGSPQMGKMRFPMATPWGIGTKSLISPEWAKSDLPTLGTTDSSAPILLEMPIPSRGCGDPLLPVFPCPSYALAHSRRSLHALYSGLVSSRISRIACRSSDVRLEYPVLVSFHPKMGFHIGGQPVKGRRIDEIAARVPEDAMNQIEVPKRASLSVTRTQRLKCRLECRCAPNLTLERSLISEKHILQKCSSGISGIAAWLGLQTPQRNLSLGRNQCWPTSWLRN